ncbi:MAG: hypothetical protein ACWGO1_08580, partial [Anaerolineales bacterium]
VPTATAVLTATAVPTATVVPTETAVLAATAVPTDEMAQPDDEDYADVISVRVSGSEGEYQFSVEISSPDTGCDRYADWWEVVSEQGEMVYRRVLLHSHVDEQPFTRSGGPVDIQAETVVWVRAHMNTAGYGGQSLRGSVTDGFEPAESSPDFAAALEDEPPLPESCAF